MSAAFSSTKTIRLLPFALMVLLVPLSGCGGPRSDFIADTSGGTLWPGLAYEGRGGSALEGVFHASLDSAANRGEILVSANEALHGHAVRLVSFSGDEPYQDGGVARSLWMWGATNNGSGILPRLFVYAVAFGKAEWLRDGELQREPTTLASTFDAVAFVARGQYRSETGRIEDSDRASTFDPSEPENGYVSDVGGTAALVLFDSRGIPYAAFEFGNLQVTRI